MSVSRRTLLKAGTVAIAAAAPSVRSVAANRPSLVVYDSRIPQSLAFAQAHGGRAIDVAHEDTHFWRNLRTAAPQGRVVGMTRWSDLVVVRGELEARGKRLKRESQSSPHQPFVWEMA